ncbi:hypothetical protein AJ80_08730 [Polytolypa hystricis UAMH7299]|uniref:J domain-containing protein n=1 Tax=Polytolypa hystricis (strain UAMH7299) TaxID=1447883 RepID=A0A2B7X2I4_POLH7|nr:hypothetical protein AJ80_08730 [Polytolypa hystricis UAMH7299]
MDQTEYVDHYAVLGVTPDAPLAEIKSQYRKLILKHHPDKNGGQQSNEFIKVQQAYEILEDEEARKEYDGRRERRKQRHQQREQSGTFETAQAPGPQPQPFAGPPSPGRQPRYSGDNTGPPPPPRSAPGLAWNPSRGHYELTIDPTTPKQSRAQTWPTHQEASAPRTRRYSHDDGHSSPSSSRRPSRKNSREEEAGMGPEAVPARERRPSLHEPPRSPKPHHHYRENSRDKGERRRPGRVPGLERSSTWNGSQSLESPRYREIEKGENERMGSRRSPVHPYPPYHVEYITVPEESDEDEENISGKVPSVYRHVYANVPSPTRSSRIANEIRPSRYPDSGYPSPRHHHIEEELRPPSGYDYPVPAQSRSRHFTAEVEVPPRSSRRRSSSSSDAIKPATVLITPRQTPKSPPPVTGARQHTKYPGSLDPPPRKKKSTTESSVKSTKIHFIRGPSHDEEKNKKDKRDHHRRSSREGGSEKLSRTITTGVIYEVYTPSRETFQSTSSYSKTNYSGARSPRGY